MNASLVVEYYKMENRYVKLVFDGREIKKENDENLKYYIDNYISDHTWQSNLEEAASQHAMALVKLKISRSKMDQIRKVLKL